MITKLETIRSLMSAGDWPTAIRFASKLPRLGRERDDILRAKDALNQPAFYLQIGKVPEALVEKGRHALIRRFGHPRSEDS